MERARRTQASGYLVKPVSFPTLRGSIEMAVHKNKLVLPAAKEEPQENPGFHDEQDYTRLFALVESFPAAMILLNSGRHHRLRQSSRCAPAWL